MTVDELIALVNEGDPYAQLLIQLHPKIAESAIRVLLGLPE